VRAVNHHDLGLTLLPQSLPHALDALLVEVGALGSTAEDDEAVLVSSSPGDGCKTLLGHTQEVVLRSSGSNSVHGNRESTIGTVLEANREGETRGEFAVQLRFRGTRTNGSKRDQIGKELRRDGIQHLRGNGHTHRSQIAVQLAGDSQALVDLETLVNVWIVDQALPADRSPRLLEVGAHDDGEVRVQLVGEGFQTLAVFDCGGGVVDGAGTNHDEEAVIALGYDFDDIFAALVDGLLGVGRDGELGGEERWGDQWVVSEDWRGCC
jgi:hypothetical protein